MKTKKSQNQILITKRLSILKQLKVKFFQIKFIIDSIYQPFPNFNLVSNLELALKNKDKLTTFSPDDFLNNFQKENKKEGEENEDDFVFCV